MRGSLSGLTPLRTHRRRLQGTKATDADNRVADGDVGAARDAVAAAEFTLTLLLLASQQRVASGGHGQAAVSHDANGTDGFRWTQIGAGGAHSADGEDARIALQMQMQCRVGGG